MKTPVNMIFKILFKKYPQDRQTPPVKHIYFPAKKPKFKKSYFTARQLQKDFLTKLSNRHTSYSTTFKVSPVEEETIAQSHEVVSTGSGCPTFDELTDGSGYSSLTSADLLSDTGYICRDNLTSFSVESSHLFSSVGTNSLPSNPLFSRSDESSNLFYSKIDDIDSPHLLCSEDGNLDNYKNQENPVGSANLNVIPEPTASEISLQDLLDLSQATSLEYFNDGSIEAILDAGSKLSSISEFLCPDDSFSVPRAIVDSSQAVPQFNTVSFAWRENLKASPANVCDSLFLESEVPQNTNISLGETNAKTCDPNWTSAKFLSSSFNSAVTDDKDFIGVLDVTWDDNSCLISSPEEMLDVTSLISSAEDLDSLNSWQGNVKDAGHTPYGSDTSEDDVFPVSLEPRMGEGDALDRELLQEAAAITKKVGSNQDFNEKTSQWVYETFLWLGKFTTLSAKDEIETDSPGPGPVTSADMSPLFEAALREVDGALWDVDRPKSSHLLAGSANENDPSEAARVRNLDLQQVQQPVVSHNLSFEAHGLVLSAQPADDSSDALPVSQGRSEFLQRSEGRSIPSFSRFERSLSASASRSNVFPAERSLRNVFPRFKRSLSDSLFRSHDRSQPYFLQRSEERPEQVFLPVLEVYSTLQPPQEVPEIQVLPLVEYHGPIYQEDSKAMGKNLFDQG